MLWQTSRFLWSIQMTHDSFLYLQQAAEHARRNPNDPTAHVMWQHWLISRQRIEHARRYHVPAPAPGMPSAPSGPSMPAPPPVPSLLLGAEATTPPYASCWCLAKRWQRIREHIHELGSAWYPRAEVQSYGLNEFGSGNMLPYPIVTISPSYTFTKTQDGTRS